MSEDNCQLLQLPDDLLGGIISKLDAVELQQLRRASQATRNSRIVHTNVSHVKLMDSDCTYPIAWQPVQLTAAKAAACCPQAAVPSKLTVVSTPDRASSFMHELHHRHTPRLCDCSSVSELHLHHINLTGVEVALAKRLCPGITRLHLHDAVLTRDAFHSERWPKLAHLELELGNRAFSLDLLNPTHCGLIHELPTLTGLQSLSISLAQQKSWDVTPIKALTALTHLHIQLRNYDDTRGTILHGMGHVQRQCTQLASLVLGDASRNTFGAEKFHNSVNTQPHAWPSLRSVHLYGCTYLGFSQLQLHHAPSLQTLVVTFNPLYASSSSKFPSATGAAQAFASLAALPAACVPSHLDLFVPRAGLQNCGMLNALAPLAPHLRTVRMPRLSIDDAPLLGTLLTRLEVLDVADAAFLRKAHEHRLRATLQGLKLLLETPASLPALKVLRFVDGLWDSDVYTAAQECMAARAGQQQQLRLVVCCATRRRAEVLCKQYFHPSNECSCKETWSSGDTDSDDETDADTDTETDDGRLVSIEEYADFKVELVFEAI